MSSGSDPQTSDDSDPSDDGTPETSGRLDPREFGILAGSILASALLHLAVVGAAHWIANLAFDFGADAQWLDTSDELTGIGHRIRNRFAELEQPEPPEEPEKTPPDKGPELDEEELKKALEGSYQPPDVPEPEPKPTPEKAPAERPKTTSDAQRRAPKETSPSEPSSDEKPSETSEERDRPFANIGDHEALDRAGPTNLPDMRSFAPGNARMSALIRVDQIRGQPYEDAVKEILRAVPDYRLLLGVDEVDPIRDMNWFFMASPDPRYIQHTFLAVRHELSDQRLVELLDQRYPNSPPWQTFEDLPVRDLVPENPHYRDPRRILLAGEGLTLVAKRKLLDQVAKPLAEDSTLLASQTPPPSEPPDLEKRERPTLIDGLVRLHRVAKRDDTILLLSARGLAFHMPGVGRLPRFESVRMAVTRPKHPTLDIDLQFADERKARRFERDCPALRTAIDDAIPFSGMMGLSSMLRELKCKVDGAYVNVHGQFTVEEVTNLGELALPFVPRPPVLSELPEPPEKEHRDAGAQREQQPDADDPRNQRD